MFVTVWYFGWPDDSIDTSFPCLILNRLEGVFVATPDIPVHTRGHSRYFFDDVTNPDYVRIGVVSRRIPWQARHHSSSALFQADTHTHTSLAR
jgi:hypothetical protein